ncbi:DUF4294 domain-containing protein [Namhaeicola litoreus]|uniref:DUF4294 domain-containing protein n=1 Tax=Namhaeicola litoreus TaxID=1052145 RepID=A0ABW3Y2C2_9FLAO
MKKIVLSLFIFFPVLLFAQEGRTILPQDLYRVENDSVTIDLDEVIVLKNRNFNDTKEKKYYYWYYKKVQKAYPYAVLASDKINELNEEIAKLPNNRKRRKFIRKKQEFFENEFADELKTLTRTEGRILIKLIHRQTGVSFYDLIKDYRSDWKAFWYNSSAKFFKLNLKSEYHPESDALDFIIEDILNRSFSNGSLERREAKIPIDYFQLNENWASLNFYDEINAYIEKYK